MRSSLFVRILVLSAAFVGILIVMRSLRSPEMQKGIADTLGWEAPLSKAGSGAVETSLDWCETRVKALERPGKGTIHQERLKWLLSGETESVTELDFVSMEKWFGRNCRIRIERVLPSTLTAAVQFQPALIVKFIKGADLSFEVTATGVFRWQQELFRSTELTKALADLDELPHRTSH